MKIIKNNLKCFIQDRLFGDVVYEGVPS